MAINQYRVLNEITVNSSALLSNYTYYARLNPQAQIAPVLKSNAYGHGLSLIASYLDWAVSAPFFCTDSLYEAYELHSNNVKTDILIMGYTHPDNYQVWKSLPFIFSVFDRDSLLALNKHQPGARVHLKLDTGMHRLGIAPRDLPAFLQVLKTCDNLRVEGIFSHLSSADDPSKQAVTNRQITLFKQLATVCETEGYHFKWRHLASSAGAKTIRDPYFNLIRLGLGLYGYSPFGPHTKEGRGERRELKPALSLISHFAMVKKLHKGDAVGYGGVYIAKQEETIGILPLGYNEGIPRKLSGRPVFSLPNRTPCPIVGRVSMNMTAIKLPRATSVKPGDQVILAPVPRLAQYLQTPIYPVLVRLHPSIRRTLI